MIVLWNGLYSHAEIWLRFRSLPVPCFGDVIVYMVVDGEVMCQSYIANGTKGVKDGPLLFT